MSVKLDKTLTRRGSNGELFTAPGRQLYVLQPNGSQARVIDPANVAATETLVQGFSDEALTVSAGTGPFSSNGDGQFDLWFPDGNYDLYAPGDVSRPITRWQNVVGTTNAQLAGKIPYALFDAKGDLLVGTANDAATRVPSGADGQRLTTDAAQPAGVKWAPKTTIPLTYDLYGAEPEDWKALQGAAAVTAYGWPGAALTANTTIFHEGLDVASITYVNWRVVWTPKAVACGIRLVLFETLAALTQVAEFTNNASTTAINSSVDITAAFKTNYAASSSLLTAGHQLKGDGTVGPLIFASRLECLFRV